MLDLELRAAIEDVKRAETNFNNSSKDKVNFAIYELMAAEERLGLILEDRKTNNKH